MEKWKQAVLDSYIRSNDNNIRFTSWDICENLRPTAKFRVEEVTEYMIGRGFVLVREDDRLVWKIK